MLNYLGSSASYLKYQVRLVPLFGDWDGQIHKPKEPLQVFKLKGYFHVVKPLLISLQISVNVADVLMSMFMNELYGFQLDNHRWYAPF
jgi:hypothetical protein